MQLSAACFELHCLALPCPALPSADDPLRHFLDDLRALYPALPTPLYTLLAALSSTADSGEGGVCTLPLCAIALLACSHPAVDIQCFN